MPNEPLAPEVSLRQLADRLVVEYSGALPPEQVLSAIYRTNCVLSTGPGANVLSTRLGTLEAVVRRLLTDRLALLAAERQHRVGVDPDAASRPLVTAARTTAVP